MDEANSMQEQVGYGRRQAEILRKNQKEILEINNTVKQMKNTLVGLLMDQMCAELEQTIETSKPENQEQRQKSSTKQMTEMQEKEKKGRRKRKDVQGLEINQVQV